MKREREMDIHHRKPRSLGGKNNPENLSEVPITEHRAWHTLFKNFGPIVIAAIINAAWLDPAWRMVTVPTGGFLTLLQLSYWYQAIEKGRKRENMDGDGI